MLWAMNGHDELSDRSLEKPVSSASIYMMLEVLQWHSSLVSCTRQDVRILQRVKSSSRTESPNQRPDGDSAHKASY